MKKEAKKEEKTETVYEYKIYPKKDSALYKGSDVYPYRKSGIPIDAETFEIKDGMIEYFDGDHLIICIPLSNVDHYTKDAFRVPAGRRIEIDIEK